MNPLVLKYPYDPDKNNIGNYVNNEIVDISSQRGKKNRCFSFQGGYFFTDTLVIIDNSGHPLIPEIDYTATHLNTEAVELTGTSVCGMVVIINPNIGDILYISAHLLGGKFVSLSPIIQECIATFNKQTIPDPSWNDIVNKPDSFLPSGHFMLWSQMYGFTEFTLAINNLTSEIENQSGDKIDGQLSQILLALEDAIRRTEVIRDKLNYHTIPGLNSHKTNATDISLANIDNYPIITTQEISTLNVNIPIRYVDVLKHNEILKYWLMQKINHFHPISLTALNTYSQAELTSMLNAKISKTQPAIQSYRLENKTITDIQSQLPNNYSATQFTSGIFAINKTASNVPSPGMLLCNDQKFHAFTELLDTNFTNNQNVVVLGNYGTVVDAITYLNTNYSSGIKTLAIFTLVKTFPINATTNDSISFMVLAMKNTNGWVVKGV